MQILLGPHRSKSSECIASSKAKITFFTSGLCGSSASGSMISSRSSGMVNRCCCHWWITCFLERHSIDGTVSSDRLETIEPDAEDRDELEIKDVILPLLYECYDSLPAKRS
jgi:hypothetical protein